MAIRASYDAARRASAELSALFERALDDPERETPPTLGEMRELLRAEPPAGARGAQEPAAVEAALAELDALIEDFGPEALVSDFVWGQASEALTRVIAALIEDPARPRPVSLAAVRDAMDAGVVARLVGRGALDEDEAAGLTEELDALIARHGPHAAAEEFLRYE